MRHIRCSIKPIGCFMAIFMLMLSGPFQSAMAAMVGTEALIDIERNQDARATDPPSSIGRPSEPSRHD